MEDLVRPGAPDPRNRPLVAQERVKPPGVGGEDPGELLGVESQRLRSQVGQRLCRLLGRDQPDAGAFLRSCLGENELGAALETEPESGRLGARVSRLEVAKATRGHQVDEQHELAVVGREQETLASPLRADEPSPLESRQRRVERLQGRDVRRAGLFDRERPHGIVEGASPGFHLGQFGHTSREDRERLSLCVQDCRCEDRTGRGVGRRRRDEPRPADRTAPSPSQRGRGLVRARRGAGLSCRQGRGRGGGGACGDRAGGNTPLVLERDRRADAVRDRPGATDGGAHRRDPRTGSVRTGSAPGAVRRARLRVARLSQLASRP